MMERLMTSGYSISLSTSDGLIKREAIFNPVKRSLLMGEKRIGILGTGSFVPERILSNFDLEKVLNTNDNWIYKRTGIKERRIAAPDVNASDLAKQASLQAMEIPLTISATSPGTSFPIPI